MKDNPIRSVRPLDAAGSPTGPAVTNLPTMTSYDYVVEDVGGTADRRAQSRRAVNRRKGTIGVITAEWRPITFANAATVLQAFRSKNLLIEYLNAETGTWNTKQFMVRHNRSLRLLDVDVGLWESAGFTLVQRIPDYD